MSAAEPPVPPPPSQVPENDSEIRDALMSVDEPLPPPSQVGHNDSEIRDALTEHTFIFIREITSRIEVHQVRERMVEGLLFSNQFALGGATGWVAAYLVKNFGKTVLTAAGGGFLILAFATRKGFIEVNWNRVFLELQKRGGVPNESGVSSQQGQGLCQGQGQGPSDESFEEVATSGSPDSSLSIGEDWTLDKIHKAKEWILEHSVVAAGFATGFIYSVI